MSRNFEKPQSSSNKNFSKEKQNTQIMNNHGFLINNEKNYVFVAYSFEITPRVL